jgi:hypothetical protein
LETIELRLVETRGINRKDYLIEQGIPVLPMPQSEVAGLRLMSDGAVVPAELQTEATDASGSVRWVMVTAALNLPANETRGFSLESRPDLPAITPKLVVSESDSGISIESDDIALCLSGTDGISLAYRGAPVITGRLAFSVLTDARSFVSGVRAIHHRPAGFVVEEKSESRCLVVWRSRVHPDVYREYSGIDERRYIDCELEIKVYAASPVIRLKWSFTNNFYYPAALDRYCLALPVPCDARVSGDWAGDKFASHATVSSSGGSFALTAPFVEDIGKGAGIGIERLEWVYDEPDGFAIFTVSPDELPAYGDGTKAAERFNSATRPPVFRTDYRLIVGGVNPPPDEGCGTDHPQVHRTLLHGMSRTFESSIILNPSSDAVAAELEPVYFTLDPQHYSDTEVLPERGDSVTFGDYEVEATRSARWLRDNQWRGSLYHGEWWREYDVNRRQGIEEAGSGNSSLGVFYHYLRTGDESYLASAKRSMQAIYDLTMNKQHDGLGPFMHTRRFLFDRENWHHPRYQRIAGMMRPSHIFCDRRMRRKACEVVRWFAEHFLDTDGAPMHPRTNDVSGDKSRCDEAAMAQFCESLVLAYHETGDCWFLEKARLMANWAVDQMESHADILDWMRNWNIQFVQRGLLAVILTTGERKFIDAYLKICRNILRITPVHDGYRDLVLWEVHFVVYFAWHFAEAHRLTGDNEMLRDYIKVLEGELARQVEDGSFPYVTAFVPRTSQWISYYDSKTAAAYLPVLAARIEAAGISRY